MKKIDYVLILAALLGVIVPLVMVYNMEPKTMSDCVVKNTAHKSLLEAFNTCKRGLND
jgi:hypothetical protein